MMLYLSCHKLLLINTVCRLTTVYASGSCCFCESLNWLHWKLFTWPLHELCAYFTGFFFFKKTSTCIKSRGFQCSLSPNTRFLSGNTTHGIVSICLGICTNQPHRNIKRSFGDIGHNSWNVLTCLGWILVTRYDNLLYLNCWPLCYLVFAMFCFG